MAQAFLAMKEPKSAAEAAARAISCQPDGEWGHRLLALAYKALGAKDRSLAEASEAARLAPVSPQALHTLGTCQLGAGQVRQAAATAERLRSLAPEWPLSHQLLTLVALKQRGSDAVEHALRAIEQDPLSAYNWNNLGAAYVRQSRRVEAAKTFIHALELDPTDEVAQRNLKGLVMPLTSVRRDRGWRMLILAPLTIPFAVYFQLTLRRKLPETIRTEFLATPVVRIEMVVVVVALLLSVGGIVLSEESGQEGAAPYLVILLVAGLLYAVLRGADTVRWWLSHRPRRNL
jgi:Flp pilus assembly protein TadD